MLRVLAQLRIVTGIRVRRGIIWTSTFQITALILSRRWGEKKRHSLVSKRKSGLISQMKVRILSFIYFPSRDMPLNTDTLCKKVAAAGMFEPNQPSESHIPLTTSSRPRMNLILSLCTQATWARTAYSTRVKKKPQRVVIDSEHDTIQSWQKKEPSSVIST